jgi:hypothetical protein
MPATAMGVRLSNWAAVVGESELGSGLVRGNSSSNASWQAARMAPEGHQRRSCQHVG